jgi:hypothetical protein
LVNEIIEDANNGKHCAWNSHEYGIRFIRSI